MACFIGTLTNWTRTIARPHHTIRFPNAAGGYTEYKLKFGKFGNGPPGEIDNSMHYQFAFDTGSRLDLYKK